MLIAVGGLIASGKSSVARAAAEALRAAHIEADALRDELLRIEPGQLAHEAAWADNLEPGVTDRIYREMLDRAGAALARDERAVVVDGCFARRAQRLAARAVAHAQLAPFLFVECRAPREVIERRLRARSAEAGIDASAWIELLERIEARFEPVDELTASEHLVVDSARPLRDAVARITHRTGGPRAAPSLAAP